MGLGKQMNRGLCMQQNTLVENQWENNLCLLRTPPASSPSSICSECSSSLYSVPARDTAAMVTTQFFFSLQLRGCRAFSCAVTASWSNMKISKVHCTRSSVCLLLRIKTHLIMDVEQVWVWLDLKHVLSLSCAA